jgi:hypothetical protein
MSSMPQAAPGNMPIAIVRSRLACMLSTHSPRPGRRVRRVPLRHARQESRLCSLLALSPRQGRGLLTHPSRQIQRRSVRVPHAYMRPAHTCSAHSFSHLITPKTGAFLTQPTLFDPLEFGIPPIDAPALPLGTRKLLEHAFLALRDSGINYRGEEVGVYTAGVGHDASVLGEAVSGSPSSFPCVSSTPSRTLTLSPGHSPPSPQHSPTESHIISTSTVPRSPSTPPAPPVSPPPTWPYRPSGLASARAPLLAVLRST